MFKSPPPILNYRRRDKRHNARWGRVAEMIAAAVDDGGG
jgi:hypothetical protein